MEKQIAWDSRGKRRPLFSRMNVADWFSCCRLSANISSRYPMIILVILLGLVFRDDSPGLFKMKIKMQAAR